jgi:DNA modification methylase
MESQIIIKKKNNKKNSKQLSLSGTKEFPSFEEIITDYSKEFYNYIFPKGENIFGFWMQTLADLELLKLELEGITKKFKINPTERTVDLEDGKEEIRKRIAHLEKVGGKFTLYSEIVDIYGDTNAYGFHNLYPFKGKFYPRVVRTLINAFNLNTKSLILDPFNGSGTTTHEASLMGIESVGIDITPIGTILAELKNELPFLKEKELTFSWEALVEILKKIENKEWKHKNPIIEKLMLIIYFDTIDAFARTSRYNKRGKQGLFNEKYQYVLDCYKKLMKLKEKFNLKFKKAKIIQGDVLELKNFDLMKEKFDAVITSPPYYFSIDYVGKDKLAYEYLGIEMKKIESKYLGMKNEASKIGIYGKLPTKVVKYYEDLKESINNIFWSLKSGGKCAIIVGDSTVAGKKIPTTIMTKRFCEEAGFKFNKLVFNPLLGARNRAIRGESIIICTKP